MDSEQIERFFIQYLEEAGLEYVSKDRIYTVKLDKYHKKLYSQEEDLVATFDVNIAQKKKISLLGLGTFIIDSIIAKYADEVSVTNIVLPLNEDDIIEVNENLGSLKNSSKYMISEVDDECTYILFETLVASANKNMTFLNPLLITKIGAIEASKLEENSFEDGAGKVTLNTKHIDKGVLFINNKNKLSIDKATKQHYKDMDELKKIQTEHAHTQYTEIESKEGKVRDQVENARSSSVSANSFDAKAKWNHATKRFNLKLDALIRNNKNKKRKIKESFDKQMDELSHRELDTSIEIKIYANIKMRYFNVKFEDGCEYNYFPVLKRFVEKK